ncbi:MAG: hypothetical protein WDO15_16315 [Bacteroidota bacterium]
MMYAVVERNTRFLGKVKSFDDTEAKKVPGVKQVFKIKMAVFSTHAKALQLLPTISGRPCRDERH